MTKPKSESLGARGPGALVYADCDVVPMMPDLTSALLDGGRKSVVQNIQGFTAALREHLALYRISARAFQEKGQWGAIAEWLSDAASNLEAAISDRRLRRLPARAEAAIASVVPWNSWSALLVGGDRLAIASCLRRAANVARRQPSEAGRPDGKNRARLLRAVLTLLRSEGVVGDVATRVASNLLKAMGVQTPAAESIRRAARR